MLIVDNPRLVFSQRRQASRVKAEIPVEVYVPDPAEPAGVRMLTGETIDVSRGGCAFALTDHCLEEGVELVLVLCIEHHPVVMTVEVLGPHPDVEVANRCRFVRITPGDQRMLAAELGRLEGLIRPAATSSLAAR
jgi:c-di-GMP-binding flagellar brake protein YcgR